MRMGLASAISKCRSNTSGPARALAVLASSLLPVGGRAQTSAGVGRSGAIGHPVAERAAVMAGVGHYLRARYPLGLAVDADIKCVNRRACHIEHAFATRPAARARRKLFADSLLATLRRGGPVLVADLDGGVRCEASSGSCHLAQGAAVYVQTREPYFQHDTAYVVTRTFTTEGSGVRPRVARLALARGVTGGTWEVVRSSSEGW